MDVVSSDDEQVTVQIVPPPFTDAEIDARHEARWDKEMKKRGLTERVDMPLDVAYQLAAETAADCREQLGLTRQDARPAVQMRRTYRLDKLAEKFDIGSSFDTEGWREAVINRVREVKKL